MRSAAIVLGLCVAGCSHASARPVRGPDGQRGWFAISCKEDQANCYEKAGEVCPGGYVMADRGGQTGTLDMVDSTSGDTYSVATYRGYMLVKCKGPPAQDEAD